MHDAVLAGILDFGINHPAVLGKLITPLTHQTVGLGDPVAAAVNHLAARPDIVVAAVNLNQTGIMQCAVQVVVQTVVLCNDTVLELSVCIKAIRTLRETAVTHPFAIVGPVDDQRTIRLGVIETAIKFEHTHVNTDTVDVVVLDAAFLDNAVLELLVMGNHAVFIEVVPPLRQQPVGLFRRDPEVLTAIRQHILHSLAVHIKVVVQIVTVRILHLCKALVPYMPTVFQPIRAVVFLAQTVLADRSELRGIDGIFAYGCKLLIPTLELVTVVLILVLLRILAGILGNGSLKNRISAQDTTILVLPSDSDSGLGNLRALLDQFLADRAVGVAGVTGCRKRCFDRIANLRLVASSRDHFLGNEDFVADRAVLALGQSGLRAGGLNCLVDDLGVSLRGNLFCFGRIADRAGKGLYALVFAGRCGRNLALVPAVSLRGNHCLCHENLIADRAMLALGLAGCGAGRLDPCVNDLSVSLGRDDLLCNDDLVTDRAMLAFGQSGLRAGGGDCRVDDLGVSLGGNSRAGAYFLAAIRTVGVAGVAWLGAGCFLGITKFCVLM